MYGPLGEEVRVSVSCAHVSVCAGCVLVSIVLLLLLLSSSSSLLCKQHLTCMCMLLRYCCIAVVVVVVVVDVVVVVVVPVAVLRVLRTRAWCYVWLPVSMPGAA